MSNSIDLFLHRLASLNFSDSNTILQAFSEALKSEILLEKIRFYKFNEQEKRLISVDAYGHATAQKVYFQMGNAFKFYSKKLLSKSDAFLVL